MADTKISNLTALAAADIATNDVIPIVDTSASETKKTAMSDLSSRTETLTNKTIALGSNTVSGTTAQFNTALSDGDFATLAGSETLTNKTLTTPVIADFTSAQHNHQNAAGGGQLAETALSLSDNTTNDVSITKHGFTPKAPNDTAKFLRGDATWATPAGSGDVSSNTATSVDNELALFSGTGGKTIKRATTTGIASLTSGVLSTVTAPSGTIVGDTDTQTLTNKTLTTPTIASFANATHNHSNAAGGGQVSASNIFNAGTVPTARLGSGTANATTFLRGDQTYAAPMTFSSGTTTKNAADASATQNIAHGLGVTPRFVEIYCNLNATVVVSGAATNRSLYATAFYNGTTQSSQSFHTVADNVTTAAVFKLNAANDAGTTEGVVTFDATNIIITWTKTNNPTGIYSIIWKAQA